MASKPTQEIDDEGAKFIAAHEGRINYVYDDSVYPTRPYVRGEKVGGTLTAGIGHTGDLDNYIGITIPDDVIDAWFDDDNDAAELAVERNVKVALRQNQRNALVSLAFNIGSGAFAGSTLVRELNKGNYEAVPAQLARWNKTTINGKKVESPGLTKRRAAEAALWSTGVTPKVETGVKGTPVATSGKQTNWLFELILSRFNATQAVALVAYVIGMFGIPMPDDVQQAVGVAVPALILVGGWVWRTVLKRT